MENSNLKPLHAIYLLLDNVYTKRYASDIASIIKLNTGELKSRLAETVTDEFKELFDIATLEKLNEDDLRWQKPTNSNLQRKAMLVNLLGFTGFNHLDLLNIEELKELVSIKHIKLALSRASFINFSVKDNHVNMHLTQQGHFLQFFLYYHLKHDMRCRAKIDSLQIEMDNPFQRQKIRNRNCKDPYLSGKYITEMQIDEWCKHLLENFFPNISGIWADHMHINYVEILGIVRFAFECGFIQHTDCNSFLKLLNRATISLLKLEEAWQEKLSKIKKLSDTMKANNLIFHFAKSREHIACILVQIITLQQDHFLTSKYSQLQLPGNSKDKAEKKRLFDAYTEELTKSGYAFMNEYQNEIVLFITMNYLSNTVQIENQRSTNQKTKQAVEKIFMYITSTFKDSFIESIKSISLEDLRYF